MVARRNGFRLGGRDYSPNEPRALTARALHNRIRPWGRGRRYESRRHIIGYDVNRKATKNEAGDLTKAGNGRRGKEYYVAEDPFTGERSILGYAAQSAANGKTTTHGQARLGKRSTPSLLRSREEDEYCDEDDMVDGYEDEEKPVEEHEASYRSDRGLMPKKVVRGPSKWPIGAGRPLVKPMDNRISASDKDASRQWRAWLKRRCHLSHLSGLIFCSHQIQI